MGAEGAFSAENLKILQQLGQAVGLKTYRGWEDLQLGLQIPGSFVPMIPQLRGCPIPWRQKLPVKGFVDATEISPGGTIPSGNLPLHLEASNTLSFFLTPRNNPWTLGLSGSQAEAFALKEEEDFAFS